MKRYLPLAILVLAALWLASTLAPTRSKSEFDLNGFGRLPVLVNGRIKPLDTVARTSLLMLQGRQSFKTPSGQALAPVEWLLDVLFRAELADAYQHFEITNPDVLAIFGLTPEQGDGKKRFAYNQLSAKMAELDRQGQLAEQTEAQARSSFQKAIVDLRNHVIHYQRLKFSLVTPGNGSFLGQLDSFTKNLEPGIEAVRARQAGQPHDEAAAKAMLEVTASFRDMADAGYLLAIPPYASNSATKDWRNAGQALLETFEHRQVDPSVLAYAGMGHAWTLGQPQAFNMVVKLYRDTLAGRFSEALKKSDAETRFNAAAPFYTSMTLYVLAGLFALVSWLKWADVLQPAAFYLTALAFVATSAGIATRMWLEGRPPVTNLYSSALFVGWGSVALCLVLEKVYRNGIGSVAGGSIGFATLIIAHNLSLSGDTLEMMRAVLDSNFWLATHVVVVTIGYSATFLAGFLAIIYVLRGVITRSLDKETADALSRMVYGIVCFATLFSFVGTILGGIWADQSWGRFWGWDPKENGALIIVLWNAIILHARWGGLIRQRGLMSLAIAGNIVTAWSWFGTNMLGVGLHSYGFTDAAFVALIGFAISQAVLIGLASLPLANWRSFAATKQ